MPLCGDICISLRRTRVIWTLMKNSLQCSDLMLTQVCWECNMLRLLTIVRRKIRRRRLLWQLKQLFELLIIYTLLDLMHCWRGSCRWWWWRRHHLMRRIAHVRRLRRRSVITRCFSGAEPTMAPSITISVSISTIRPTTAMSPTTAAMPVSTIRPTMAATS